jgi:hypothetical protein
MMRATTIPFRGLARLADIPAGTQIDIAGRSLYLAYHFGRYAYLWPTKAAYARDCMGAHHDAPSWAMKAAGWSHFITMPPRADEGAIYVD